MADYTWFLPHLNALLNTTSTILLITGYRLIRRGQIEAHKRCQLSALATSIAFLASYLTYHYFHGTTRFTGQGIVRAFYFIVLTSHTILAVIIVPLVAITLWRAFHEDFLRHRRIARITLPLWLYVSVTGVLVYFMLYHLFPSR